MLTAAALSLSILASTSVVNVPLFGPSTAEAAITTGDRLVGNAEWYYGKVTYVFGSRDLANLRLDCSSFTQLVYKNLNISIPWGSKAQAAKGRYVSRSSLQKGDLVFFRTHGSAIDHVAIYQGGGRIIHNLPNRGIVSSNMNDSYWSSRYVTARHIR
ncbi:C40 family peptidase [Paenibacillus chartarius]|uniref:C40 family peptidase n=1 Tax=Paenibacillus chartarius TaxID=747481 RepID=A0ABV6DMU3_9BACL